MPDLTFRPHPPHCRPGRVRANVLDFAAAAARRGRAVRPAFRVGDHVVDRHTGEEGMIYSVVRRSPGGIPVVFGVWMREARVVLPLFRLRPWTPDDGRTGGPSCA